MMPVAKPNAMWSERTLRIGLPKRLQGWPENEVRTLAEILIRIMLDGIKMGSQGLHAEIVARGSHEHIDLLIRTIPTFQETSFPEPLDDSALYVVDAKGIVRGTIDIGQQGDSSAVSVQLTPEAIEMLEAGAWTE